MHTAILVEYEVLSLSTFIYTHTKTIETCLKFNLFFTVQDYLTVQDDRDRLGL